MPLHADALPWTPSPPLAPDLDHFDDDALAALTRGHAAVAGVVLRAFALQSRRLIARIDQRPERSEAELATLATMARGIGALRLAEAADYAGGALGEADGRRAALGTLRMALDGVLEAIDQRLDWR